MSHVSQPARAYADEQGAQTQEASLGSLVSSLSEQIPALIHSEIKLAQAEVTEKGKRAGIGIGIFSVAGLLAFFGLGLLLTTLVLVLATFLDAWLAALIVTVVVLAAAGVAALIGKKKVQEAGPPVPERAVESVKQDVATVKEHV